MKRIRFYLLLYFTGTALLQFAYRTLDRLARGSPSDWQIVLIEQGTGVYGTAVLLIFLIWAFRRYPFRRSVTPWLQHAFMLVSIFYSAYLVELGDAYSALPGI